MFGEHGCKHARDNVAKLKISAALRRDPHIPGPQAMFPVAPGDQMTPSWNPKQMCTPKSDESATGTTIKSFECEKPPGGGRLCFCSSFFLVRG